MTHRLTSGPRPSDSGSLFSHQLFSTLRVLSSRAAVWLDGVIDDAVALFLSFGQMKSKEPPCPPDWHDELKIIPVRRSLWGGDWLELAKNWTSETNLAKG